MQIPCQTGMTGKWRILRGLVEEQGTSTTVIWAKSRTTAQIGGNLTHHSVPVTPIAHSGDRHI